MAMKDDSTEFYEKLRKVYVGNLSLVVYEISWKQTRNFIMRIKISGLT